MPPNSPKIPDAEIDADRKLDRRRGASKPRAASRRSRPSPSSSSSSTRRRMGKPAGAAAMPENLLDRAVRSRARSQTRSWPWRPAPGRRWWRVGGHKQVLLYRTTDTTWSAFCLSPREPSTSSSSAATATCCWLAAGGAGSRVWPWSSNVKTGQRVFEIGKEYDAVLAADISPDHGQVALGGPSKVVRVYNTADGTLMFEMKKHTEWITAVEFSPDGVLLATGDRNNGLVVWEAQTGREFFDLRGHTAAITDISWRLDSNVVASSSEDGSVKLWEMENGRQIKSIAAHGGGVESVRFAKDGRLVSTGRDRVAPRLGRQRQQAARVRALRRHGSRGRLQPR